MTNEKCDKQRDYANQLPRKIPQTLHHRPDSAWPLRVIWRNLPLIVKANSSFTFNLHFMATFLTHFLCQSHPRRKGESYRFLLLRRRAEKKFVDKPRRRRETQAAHWRIFSGYVINVIYISIPRTNLWCVKVEFRGWPWSEFRARASLLLCRVKTNWRLNESRVVGRSVSGDENKSDSSAERVLFELDSDMSLSRHWLTRVGNLNWWLWPAAFLHRRAMDLNSTTKSKLQHLPQRRNAIWSTNNLQSAKWMQKMFYAS